MLRQTKEKDGCLSTKEKFYYLKSFRAQYEHNCSLGIFIYLFAAWFLLLIYAALYFTRYIC